MKRKSLWVKFLLPFVGGILILGLITAGCAPTVPEKESIRVGFSTSLTGIYAAGAESQMNAQVLWAEQVNEEGGIYVKDIGKRLPIELVYYDDKSSPEEMIKIYEKLITVDKVDLLLPPWGTALHVALVPTAEKYHMPIVGTTACSVTLRELKADYIWFVTKCIPDEQMPTLVGLLSAHKDKVKTVAVLYIHDMFPIENDNYLIPALEKEGFDVVLHKDYPMGVTDLSEVLLEIKGKNPDALIALTYPADCFLMMKQAMEVGLNPKFYYSLVGPGCSAFSDIFGPATEGICMQGAWTEKGPGPGSKEFYDSYVERWNKLPDNLDSALSWVGCQVMEQAIDKAGTLDPEKLRDVIATEEFVTIEGPKKFAGSICVTGYPGHLQWQKGKVEIVWPPEIATAELMIPKPAWPK